MAKKNTRLFDTRIIDGVLEVWDGPPESPESEPILRIDQTLVPQLIATLSNQLPHRKKD